MRISGYACVFDQVDSCGDVITQGAFRASLKRNTPQMVAMRFNHDPAHPIGIWDEITEDQHGLKVSGRLLLEKEHPKYFIRNLVIEGALTGLSIGYKTLEYEARPVGRILKRIDLWEISIVSMPMVPLARFKVNQPPPPPPPPPPIISVRDGEGIPRPKKL